VRDKIAQEAVRSVIAPLLEKTFVDCSYAYRVGKGPQKAIRRVEHYLLAKKFWVAVADIDRFFDTMDQELTLEEVKKYIAAPDILRLLSLWMKMGAMDSRGHWIDPLSGVAQGSVLSPLLSNVYLTPFDAYLTHKGHALVRYADNFILLASSTEAVQQALGDATSFLEQRLKLRLNAEPQPVSSLETGFVFLGIDFHGLQRRIAEAKIQQMQAEIRHCWQRYAQAPVPQLIAKLNETILGWKRYYGMVQPVEQFQALDGYIAEGLARALALRLTRGDLERNADLLSLLADLAFLCDLSEPWKKASLGRIVRRAKDLRAGKHAAPPVQTPSALVNGQPAAAATPAPTSTTPASPATVAPPALRPVEQVVKQQKRRYLRQAVQGAELVISEPGVFLGKTSSRVVVKKQRRVIMEMPIRQLRHIIITTSGVTLVGSRHPVCP
jgi:group II intron reverse transcriptase/maturase